MSNIPTTGISVNVLRISVSGKAVEVQDPELPQDQQLLWIPISILCDDSVAAVTEAVHSLGGLTDLNVQTWFLEKNGWA